MNSSTNMRHTHLGFIDDRYPANTHMCLIYDREEERKTLIEKFIAAAIDDKERVEYFYDEWPADAIRRNLGQRGLPCESMENSGQLRFRHTSRVYHPNGNFSPEAMWGTLCDCFTQGCRDGFDGVRLGGEMTWALKGIPGSERLIEYESGINNLIADHPMLIICQYDANRFDGATLMDVLRVHPFMIARGRVVSNPYYEDLTAAG
ncbi:MAG: MEDS domain-containing protein [Gammaproteobacteria bacterium]